MSGKFSRRELFRLSGMAGALALLTACQPATQPAGEVAPAEEATLPPGEAEPTAVTERITVEWMNWWGAQREELMNEVIRRFEAEFPHIHVENQVQPWDNAEQRRATAIASRTPPGLLMAPRSEAQKFAYEGLIIPIDDYIELRGHDLYDIFLASEVETVRFQDKTWSYPLPGSFLDSSFWLYNKNVMREFDLDPDAPPVTWQDVDAAMAAMTTFDGSLLKTLGLGGFTGRFPSWIYCNNGQYYSDDARELRFSQPEGVETLEWIASLLEAAGGIEAYNGFFEGLDAQKADYPFYLNKLGMDTPNVSIFGHFKTHAPDMYNDPDQWGVMLVAYNGNNPNAKATGISGLSFTWNQVIPKGLSREVEEAAYEFLEFFTMREEGGGYFLLEQGRPSPVRRFNENPKYYEMNPYWDDVLAAMQIDVGVPTTPVQVEIGDIVNRQLEEVWFGLKTPKEALEAAYDEAQPILDAFWAGS